MVIDSNDSEATLKRVFYHGDSMVLQPANPAFSPLVFTGPAMDEVRILGKAVGFISTL